MPTRSTDEAGSLRSAWSTQNLAEEEPFRKPREPSLNPSIPCAEFGNPVLTDKKVSGTFSP